MPASEFAGDLLPVGASIEALENAANGIFSTPDVNRRPNAGIHG